jgi:hypothetical protein
MRVVAKTQILLFLDALSALSAQLLPASENNPSLALLLVELEALTARFYAQLTLVQPQHLPNQSLQANAVNTNHDQLLTGAATFAHNSFGYDQGDHQDQFWTQTTGAADGTTSHATQPLNDHIDQNRDHDVTSFMQQIDVANLGSSTAVVPNMEGVDSSNGSYPNHPWNDLFDWNAFNNHIGSGLQGNNDSSSSNTGFSAPAAPVAALVTAPNRLHICTNCGEAFTRRSDRDRHARKHDPNATQFPCSAQHCTRSFPRKDKLLDHRRRMRH